MPSPPARFARLRLLSGFVVAPIAAVVLVALVVVGIRTVHDGQVMPGTRVAGISLGGKTEIQARTALTEHAGRPVTLRGRNAGLRLLPAETGVALDVEATLDEALEVGRTGPLGGAWSTIRSLFVARDVEPVVTVDDKKLDRAVARVAARVGRRADDGALRIDPDTLTATTSTPRDGRSVERDELARRLRAAARDDTTAIDVPVKTLRAASAKDLREVAAQAERFLDRELRVDVGGSDTTVTPRRLAPLLAVSSAGGGVTLGTSAEEVSKLVAELARRLDRAARAPRFTPVSAPASLDAKGDVTWRPKRARVRVAPGRTGREIAREPAVTAIEEAVRARSHDVTLETRASKPAVDAAAAKRVKFLIGTFTTRYEPGQPRVQNIRRIARTVDGTVIPPGGQFSLNGVSGPRTLDKGYVKAPFIADGKIVPSVGGGVSQASTTIYNAAFFAGLQIDSSQPHSLYIDRYPPGREATLNFPDIDLKWTNDTEAPVVVRAITDATSITVQLFGDNDRRKVGSEAGSRQPVPGRNFSIEVTRVITYGDGREVRQPRTTTYDNPVEE